MKKTKILLAAAIIGIFAVGCGNTGGDTSQTPSPSAGTGTTGNGTLEDVTDGAGDAVKDVTDGVGNAVKDAGDAVNNAANSVTGKK